MRYKRQWIDWLRKSVFAGASLSQSLLGPLPHQEKLFVPILKGVVSPSSIPSPLTRLITALKRLFHCRISSLTVFPFFKTFQTISHYPFPCQQFDFGFAFESCSHQHTSIIRPWALPIHRNGEWIWRTPLINMRRTIRLLWTSSALGVSRSWNTFTFGNPLR